jgi:hypothetical protein
MIHSKFSLVLLSFLSWYDSCMSCDPPPIELDGLDDPSTEEPPPEDSGEDTFVAPPPPACDFPEEEPNSTKSDADEIETELWACGVLAPDSDEGGTESATDWLTFTVPESGWLRTWARGEDIGSYADLQMSFWVDGEAGEVFVGTVKHSPGTMDPRASVPVQAGDQVHVGIVAENFSGTDQQLWEFLATTLKEPPVYWNKLEDVSSSNENVADAFQVIESGDWVFGAIGVGDSVDSYLIEVPDASTTVHVDIEAYDYGSPLDSRLTLLEPDSSEESGYAVADSNNNGPGADLDPDPEVIVDTVNGGTWVVRVHNAGTFYSPYHWYVMRVTLSDGPDTP